MDIYAVVAAVSNFCGKPTYTITIAKYEAEDKPKSYVWHGRRLQKDKMRKIEVVGDGFKRLSVKVYTSKVNLDEDTEKLKSEIIKQLALRKDDYEGMIQASLLEPDVKIVEEERYW